MSDRLVVLVEPGPGFAPDDWIASLDEGFPEWRDSVEVHFPAGRRARRALLPRAHVFVSTWISQRLVARGGRLEWIHVAMSGADGLDRIELRQGLDVTSAAGVAAAGMAEHALGLMIALDRGFHVALERQAAWSWDQSGILERIRGLGGRTVAIAGLGHSGRALAERARALGMRVVGVSRSRPAGAEVDELLPPDELPRALEAADFLVLCAALTDDTRGLVGEHELAALGPASYLVNVARGELVDEAALARALKQGRIAGAGLDVLSEEPPARRHVLRGCPNLIVTPHVAGNVYTFRREIRGDFVARLRARVAAR
ncbi:MAG: D-2-hydroxyacid dehydrogenase [Actinomycetota bacterium]|nr:D-2-hydroxyacid dehydrogenase [Actinomycetota bacterium]